MICTILALIAASVPGQSDVTITIDPTPMRIVRNAGGGGYQAFPDICRLKSNELMVVFYNGYGHVSQPNAEHPLGGRVCAVRSNDEGATWSPAEVVVDTPKDDRDPSIACMPNGDLIVSYFEYGKHTECDTKIVRSSDGGKTWSEPQLVAPSFACSSPVRRLRKGRLLLPVYTVDGTGGARAYSAVCASDDGGRTWLAPVVVGLEPGLTLDETDLFERKDGTIFAMMREVMASAESKDGGRTWTRVAKTGFPGHCPYMLMSNQGVLLMAHRVPMTALHYSTDEGRTWRGPVTIDSVIGAYPSMVTLKDGSVLCVYYEEGVNSAIRAKRIRVSRAER